jgi:hypothetical protein
LLANPEKNEPEEREREMRNGGPDVSLPNEDTRMVNAFRQAELEDLSLETSLQEVFDFQSQHVIQSHTAFVQHTNPYETTDESIAFEKTLRIFGVELKELTGSTTDFGEDEGNAPDFALVAETVFTRELVIHEFPGMDESEPFLLSIRHRGGRTRMACEVPCNCAQVSELQMENSSTKAKTNVLL